MRHYKQINSNYIECIGTGNGGTKTGSAVTVEASELVSGTKEITANGTDIDVTEYEKVARSPPVLPEQKR